jgi:hypothetical protein
MTSGTLALLANFLFVEARVWLLMKHFDSVLGFDSLLPGVSESRNYQAITTDSNKNIKNTSKTKHYSTFLEKIIFLRQNYLILY